MSLRTKSATTGHRPYTQTSAYALTQLANTVAMAGLCAATRAKYAPHVKSNPIPSVPLYAWRVQADGSWIGAREDCKPIVIQAHTPAPARRIRFDRGTITKTLGDGLGTVALAGPTSVSRYAYRQRDKGRGELVHAKYNVSSVGSDRRTNKRLGIILPKAPSWHAEIAGWSRDHRIERGERSLFDHCCRGKAEPRKCSLPRSGIDILPACWHDKQQGGIQADAHVKLWRYFNP